MTAIRSGVRVLRPLQAGANSPAAPGLAGFSSKKAKKKKRSLGRVQLVRRGRHRDETERRRRSRVVGDGEHAF